MFSTFTTSLSALAFAAVAATGTAVVLDDDEPTDTDTVAVAQDGQDGQDDSKEPSDDAKGDCGPADVFPGGFGDGDLPAWVEDRIDEALAELPAELRKDIEEARDLQGDDERLAALEDIRDRALAGDYGAEVQEQAEGLQDAFGAWSEWRGERPGGPWGGHGG